MYISVHINFGKNVLSTVGRHHDAIVSTVVPPIYDPSDQRPPLVYDRVCYGRTKFVLQLPLVSDHLSNATSDR